MKKTTHLSMCAVLIALALALSCGVLMVCVASGTELFGLQGAWPRLIAAGSLFAVLYALPVLVLDPELRHGLATLRTKK